MNGLSPKIEIINHFDNLINRVDIDIDGSLEKYKQEQTIGELECFKTKSDVINRYKYIELKGNLFDQIAKPPAKKRCQNLWSESTKVVHYLNEIRERTIEELRQAQNDTLDHYKLNSSNLKEQLKDLTQIEDLESQVFSETFYFQVLYKPPKQHWVFNLYTIITDFYMSLSDIEFLEKAINARENDKRPFGSDFKLIIDEKMVLIGLIEKHFFKNLETNEFPSHVIQVSKQDLLKFNTITFLRQPKGVNLTCSTKVDLSSIKYLCISNCEIEEMKIENLSSLNSINCYYTPVERISLKNLFALNELTINPKRNVNSDISEMIINHCSNIESLSLDGSLSKFNLDKLNKLEKLLLKGNLMKDFDFDIFKNLCNQLAYLTISCRNIDNEMLFKMFNGLNFVKLSYLSISSDKITRLDKNLFDKFPMLKLLSIHVSNNLLIDGETFSSLKRLTDMYILYNSIDSLENKYFSELTNLVNLYLHGNKIKVIQENAFSNLKKLEKLDLSHNQIENLSQQAFFGLRKLKYLDLRYNKLKNFDLSILENFEQIVEINLTENPIINKDEILTRFKDSKIKLIF